MSKWVYDGYTKVYDDSRRHMIERWCYRCSECGHIVRTEPIRKAITAFKNCPNCEAKMDGGDEDADKITG